MLSLNPFRRIKDLEFDVDVRDRTIENLKKEIENLKSPTPKHHPDAICIGCEHLVIEERPYPGGIEYNNYFCKLDNRCQAMKQRKFVGGDTNVR